MPNRRLDSLGEIAKYLNRDPSTVTRWVRLRGLPVHHVPGGRRHTVYAYTDEIDSWLGNGNPHVGSPVEKWQRLKSSGLASVNAKAEPGTHVKASGKRSMLWTGRAVLATLAILGALGYWLIPSRPSPVVLGYQQLTNDGYLKQSLLADGARVYFVESTPRGNIIAQVPAAGGGTAQISTFFRNPSLLAINPHHSEILLSDRSTMSPGALWILPLDTGEPQRIGTIMSNAAAFSPDGSTIAYSTDRQVWLCRLGGQENHKIATLPNTITSISWQSGSNLLAVSLAPFSGAEPLIWAVNSDGSNLRPFDEGWRRTKWVTTGQWGPGGEFFLKSEGPPGSPGSLRVFSRPQSLAWLRKIQGIKLGIGPLGVGEFAPGLIPGTVFVNGQVPRCNFERYDPHAKEFVPALTGVSGNELSFSPDGQSVVYVGSPGKTLLEERLHTSSPVRLTLPPMETELPRWSPDGKWIAFMGRMTTADAWHVYLVRADGGEYYQVTRANYSEGAPTWSPDGTRLIFGEIGNPPGPPSDQCRIHMVNLKTREESLVPGSAGHWTARWSPDGKHIAALTADSHVLMVFSFGTKTWKKLGEGEAISDLDWSKDSRAILFLDGMGPNGLIIYKVSLDNQKVEQVTGLKELEATTGWLGLTPDGSPLVSQQRTSSEIYALHWGTP